MRFLDKDLVLPPMGTAGAALTCFVVASTDLHRSGIMTARIREQLERLSGFQSHCTLSLTTVPVVLPSEIPGATLEEQVQTVADCVTQIILATNERKTMGAVNLHNLH